MFAEIASRRSWMAAEARASTLRTISRPSLGDVFFRGFMNGSMLQMAVCSPPRNAAMAEVEQKYAAVYVTRLSARVAADETVSVEA
ncbi:MAG: hypothetical protein O3A53_19585 [Acidobacteria bacterium]|nr:hypothetical protein [Acidobacteriota bacterium]MDA1236985.1 hypothetical protein [Acidobacteriota bacterium]